MYRQPNHYESRLSRRFSQVFVVALAILITSGTGLLSFVNQNTSPEWLKTTVTVSAILVGLSFAGWVLSSFSGFLREEAQLRQQVRQAD